MNFRINGNKEQRTILLSGVNELSETQKNYCTAVLKHFIEKEHPTSIRVSGA